MASSYLDFNDVNAVARQAVDLLIPTAQLVIDETPRSNAYVYPQATGGDHGFWRVRVTIAPGNSAVLTLDPRSSRASALATLIRELSEACHGEFRGRYFPSCAGHNHPAGVSVEGDVVVLMCQDDHRENVTLIPHVPS